MKIRLAWILSVLVVLGLCWQCTGLRRSEGLIHQDILRLTPLGSTSAFVTKIIREQNWVSYGYHTTGFYRNSSGKPETVGKASIRASRGDYHGLPFVIFSTNVTVFWAFDEDDRLIEVWIWKTVDAL